MKLAFAVLVGMCVGHGRGDEPVFVLPGAVSKAPDWLKGPAPFDLTEFFKAPPPQDNAAPLYLDALTYFGVEMLNWHPDANERAGRRGDLTKNVGELVNVEREIRNDPASVAKSDVDAAIAPFADGFRKIVAAQRREQCVFETGISITALLPHAQATRAVGRVASLRVHRALDDAEFERAIGDVEISLRLARDLQRRGFVIQQLCAASLLRTAANEMIGSILAAPGLQPEHCDRLLNVLRRHEERAVDAYVEGFRVEYVMNRATLHDLINDQEGLAKSYGVEAGGSIVKAIAEPMITAMLASGKSNVPNLEVAPSPWPADADAIVAKTSPDELDAQIKKLNTFYGELFALRDTPYSERLKLLPNPLRLAPGVDPLSRALRGMIPAAGAFTASYGRTTAILRGFECLLAVRRWELVHGARPASLASAMAEAGWKAVPLDPFDGKPMRLRNAGELPLVYSVGPDGVDDRGLEESHSDRQVGDVLFFMPRTPGK